MMKNPFKQKTGVELEVPLPLCLQSDSNILLEFFIFDPDRGDVIRTRDLYVPNVALYQTEPRPVCLKEGPDCEAIGKIPYDTASPHPAKQDSNGRATARSAGGLL